MNRPLSDWFTNDGGRFECILIRRKAADLLTLLGDVLARCQHAFRGVRNDESFALAGVNVWWTPNGAAGKQPRVAVTSTLTLDALAKQAGGSKKTARLTSHKYKTMYWWLHGGYMTQRERPRAIK